MTYNKIAYNRYLVSPSGHDLLHGLGEFKNPWGYVMSDNWFGEFMQKNYHLAYGTVEINEKAHELFVAAVTEQPLLYLSMIVRRLPSLFFFNSLWTNNVDHLFDHCKSTIEKIMYGISHPLSVLIKCIDYAIARLHYIEFFLLLGWIGMFLAWRHRYHQAVIFTLCIAFSCISKLPSHMEARYLVIFYWVFAFFVGYAINYFYLKIKNIHQNYLLVKNMSKESLHFK